MKSRVPLFVLAVAVLAAGCEDTRTTAPRPQLGDPSKMIFDGAHNGGNADFFFLPPIGNDPKGSSNYSAGMFNPNLAPAVKICLLNTVDLTALATAECVAGPAAAEIHSSDIHTAEEFYQVVWRLRDAGLDPDGIYRIQVFVGSTRLGFADMAIVNTKGEAKSLITNEVLPINSVDRSLPIKFRIETGALTGGASSACKGATGDCLEVSVTKAGGTFFTNTHWAGIQLLPGWASDAAFALGGGSIVLTIERVRSDGNCHDAALGHLYAELAGCYHYATDPDLDDTRLAVEDRGFQTPGNKVGQCTDKLPTDPGLADADYLLFKSDPGQPITALKDVTAPLGLSCANFAFYQGLPSDPVLRFASIKWHSLTQLVSRFVVNEAYAWDGGLGGQLPTKPSSALSNISRGVGLFMNRVSADNQSVPVGGYVDVTVRVTDAHPWAAKVPVPKAGVPVTFSVVTGGGYLSFGEGEPPVLTDENGEATVRWYLGPTAGTNTLTAEAATIDPTGPITFTATGYSPLVSCPPTLDGADLIERGFYVPSFPGTTLDRLELYLTSRPNSPGGQPSDAAGIYALRLTARLNTYDGFLVGTSTASATLSGVSGEFVPISFSFPSLPVPQGSRVTFALTYVSRPAGGEALYNTNTTNAGCPIVQTDGTTPPLDLFRRNGIGVLIFGASGGT